MSGAAATSTLGTLGVTKGGSAALTGVSATGALGQLVILASIPDPARTLLVGADDRVLIVGRDPRNRMTIAADPRVLAIGPNTWST
jgi:hypothetical protein